MRGGGQVGDPGRFGAGGGGRVGPGRRAAGYIPVPLPVDRSVQGQSIRMVRILQLQIENDEYAAFVRRILHAYSRRVGEGDVEALALMLGLAEEIDAAIAEAVKGLRACATPGPRSAPGSASPARPPSNDGVQPDPAAWPDKWATACPLRARSGSQPRVLAVTRGYLHMPADLCRGSS